MKIYKGERLKDGAVVSVTTIKNGEERISLLNPRYDLYNHSPDGFEWGYGGSGPAQLALALLADRTDDETTLRLYQQFKRDVIVRMEKRKWTLTSVEITKWIIANI